jgi:hypothetical protein
MGFTVYLLYEKAALTRLVLLPSLVATSINKFCAGGEQAQKVVSVAFTKIHD